ncbi:hypothetical protein A9Q95_15115 [Rhodobacterales bacterium 59_46_T64]|nr:hypothetical protein A9Q95_15115 [Rhodobacterales bacterium 59_46_T64]
MPSTHAGRPGDRFDLHDGAPALWARSVWVGLVLPCFALIGRAVLVWFLTLTLTLTLTALSVLPARATPRATLLGLWLCLRGVGVRWAIFAVRVARGFGVAG